MRRSLGWGPSVCLRAHTLTHLHTGTGIMIYHGSLIYMYIYIYTYIHIYTRVLQFQNLFQLQVQRIVFFFLMYLPPSIFGFFWGFPNFSTMYVCSVQNCTLPYWFYLQHIGSHNDSEFVVSRCFKYYHKHHQILIKIILSSILEATILVTYW